MTTCRLIYLSLLLTLPLLSADLLKAQNNGGEQEVYLTFRYQNLFNIYVTAYYVDGEFLLPHMELFRVLQIDANADLAGGTVSGQFLNEGYYEINYHTGSIRFRGRDVSLPPDEYMARELDFFIHPSHLADHFGLDFTVDFGNLALRLETESTLPVVAQREREQQRNRALYRDQTLFREYYPLQFDRERKFLEAGFFDYNLSANYSRNFSNYVFNSGIGTEVIGGDFQGNIFGNWSEESFTLRSNNLRWRYGIRDSPVVSHIIAGQTTSNGLRSAPFTGIQITNEPIEPRYMFDDYVFSGTTIPDSEVELFRNNTMIDFQRADEMGNYHFQVPITYGTSQYNLRAFSPTGQLTEQARRIQIPFDFLPPGEFNYTLNAGRLDNPILGSTRRGYVAKGRAGAGITNWLSLSAGAEYFDDYHDTKPTYSAAISTRIFSKYLFRFEGATDAFYRVNASVVYPSSGSINFSYTRFTRSNGLYNPSQNRSQFRANIFTPFEIGRLPLYFRWSVNHEQRLNTELTRYRVDLNTRIGPLNFRFGYQDSQLGRVDWVITHASRVTGSTTYNIRRTAGTPRVIRGSFLRLQANYSPHAGRIDDTEFQFSRSLFRQGRFQIAGGHNFRGDFNFFRLNLAFDFNRARSNTTARGSRGNASVTQSVRGSVGYDSDNSRFTMSNRQQVGRSAVAVRMFVDENNNGVYDEGEPLVGETAVRIERAGGVIYNDRGITYITQLQPYRRYNLMVNKSAIRNPMLVPQTEQFSFVSDPNQYKSIDIPLYMSGVVEGRVERRQQGSLRELPGVRLYLNQTDAGVNGDPFIRELRTFSDGSFYEYEVPPASYELYIDPSQLSFLNALSSPERHTFEVRPLPDGDFVTGLDFTVEPKDEPVQEPVITDPVGQFQPENGVDMRAVQHNIRRISVDEEPCFYQIQIGSFSTPERAGDVAMSAANETGIPFTVTYYPEIEQYAVRTRQITTFANTLTRARQFDVSPAIGEYAILNRCTAETADSPADEPQAEVMTYEIQMAAFGSRSGAEQYLRRLTGDHQVDAFIAQAPGQELFRVRTGPYPDRESAEAARDEMLHRGVADELYLAEAGMRSPGSVARPETGYSFRLQAGFYSAERDAVEDAIRLRDEFGVETWILVDEENRNHLLLENEFTDWNTLLQSRADLIRFNGDRQPILHLIER